MSRQITTLDGKYTLRIPDGDWKIHVYRYGEPWLTIEAGHNAIADLMSEIEEWRNFAAVLCRDGGHFLHDHGIDKTVEKITQEFYERNQT